MLKTTHETIRALALILITAVQAPLAHAGRPFTDIAFFGDSLSDPGNAYALTGEASRRPFDLIPSAAYAWGGFHFSNGPTWAEQFARALRVPSGPAFGGTGAFSNYAVGGARARAVGPLDLSQQVGVYLARPGTVDGRALHVVFIGGNDVRDALEALADDPGGTTSAAIIAAAVTAIGDNIAALASAGAHRFLIFGAPDLALVPAVRLQGPVAQGAAGFLSDQFNRGLSDALDALALLLPGIDVTRVDLSALLNEVAADPAAVGLTDVEDSCITPGVIVGAVCSDAKHYLFWDGIHPTRAAHRLIRHHALVLLGLRKPAALPGADKDEDEVEVEVEVETAAAN